MLPPRPSLARLVALLLLVTSLAAAALASSAADDAGTTTSGAHSPPASSSSLDTTTPQEAYTEALGLLRSIIDPNALRAAIPEQHRSKTTHATDSQAAATTNGNGNGAGHADNRVSSQRSRTTLSDLSPYFTFLTSWGPFGTVLRLSLRIQWWVSDFVRKLQGLVPFTDLQSPLALFGGRSHLDRVPDPRSSRLWPGELPEQLWPEWEPDAGRLALHGPFLLDPADTDRSSSSGAEPPSAASVLGAQALAWLRAKLPLRLPFDGITTIGRGASNAETTPTLAAAAARRRQDAVQLLQYAVNPPAPHRPSSDALWVLAQHHVHGTHGQEPRPWLAIPHLTRLVEEVQPGNSSARSQLAWLWSNMEMWKAWGHDEVEQWPGQAQSLALLHHTLAARQGDYPSQMALAFRNLAGIGTTPDCGEALRWYERAASQSHMRFERGPVGGLTPPYTHLRLSDLAGGVYGPGASAASTGWAAHRPAIQAALHSLPSSSSTGSTGGREPSRLNDLLEFYSYHASGGSISHTLRLARIYYQGSIYGASESAGKVPRDYLKARELALKVARLVWPVEVANLKMANGKRVTRTGGRGASSASTAAPDEDVFLQVEPHVQAQAGAAAALLGRMYLRGEGAPVDYQKAYFWFWRGAEVSDRDCQYGYGLMRSLGMAPDQWARTKDGKLVKQGENIDLANAITMWDEAVKSSISGHADSSAALGKIHLKMGDLTSAGAHFAAAVRTGSPFEGFYGLGLVNSKIYKQSLSTLSPPGANENRCRAAVTFFKHTAERGDWESPAFHRGMRAWELGDRKRALVYWSMAAERGDEAAQNNIAWVLDRDKRRWKVPALDGPADASNDRLALIYWTRSAAQDNVDALVKLGDYYFHGYGLTPEAVAAAVGAAGAAGAGGLPPSLLAPSNHSGGGGFGVGGGVAPPTSPEYEKALACYAAAADRQISALAYWNMGYLYESGLGVLRRDFHLAKRYYDRALEINVEAFLPVVLSLVRLHLKALWATVWEGEESAVALFSSYAGAAGGAMGGYTEAQEEILRSRAGAGAGAGAGHGQGGVDDAGEYYYDDDTPGGGDPNLPETYDLRGGGAAQQQQPRPQGGGGEQQNQPQQHGHGHGHGQGHQPQPAATGGNPGNLMSLSEDEADAMIEGAMMVIGLSALAMLVYARQAAQARAEQERREVEERARREAAAAQGAPATGAGGAATNGVGGVGTNGGATASGAAAGGAGTGTATQRTRPAAAPNQGEAAGGEALPWPPGPDLDL